MVLQSVGYLHFAQLTHPLSMSFLDFCFFLIYADTCTAEHKNQKNRSMVCKGSVRERWWEESMGQVNFNPGVNE